MNVGSETDAGAEMTCGIGPTASTAAHVAEPGAR